MINTLFEALGLILGSMVTAIGIGAGAWTIFARIFHPEWSALVVILALIAAMLTRLVHGEFFSMVAILMLLAVPILWTEGRAWRGRLTTRRSHRDFHPNNRG